MLTYLDKNKERFFNLVTKKIKEMGKKLKKESNKRENVCRMINKTFLFETIKIKPLKKSNALKCFSIILKKAFFK